MKNLNEQHITIIIPYFKAAKGIVKVVSKLPDYINQVVIVDDKSPEALPLEDIQQKINPNIQVHVVRHEKNQGVGGATKSGFKKALELDTDFVVKVDADDQMDLSYLPQLIEPLMENKAEVAKGNRFRDFDALKKMPLFRRMGNLALSLLIKSSTGYWHNFDPTNGFFAMKKEVLQRLNFKNLDNRYYFETSLLAELYFHRARIKDVAMPAIYGDEKSNMQVWKMPFVFMPKLIGTFLKRLVKGYLLYDFNPGSIYLIMGIPMFLFGFIFGIYTWVYYASRDIFTPTGTIMIITLTIILGFQLILQATQYDIINAPKAED
ncbi:MAG: glycosyltransferase family 2 protein [Flavobacteriales bacterium]|nr:glycosyltransferase family 2 protein [Flavobacteriales bacterium]